MTTLEAARVVLVGGHESGDGADLVRFEPIVGRTTAIRRGRRLHDVLTSALADGGTVVVVPMTFGRDPAMVADTARALRWLTTKHVGTLALAAPFGVLGHLTARLRAVAREVRSNDREAALVIVARASNPFDDAELYKIAHLVGVHGAGTEVMPAPVTEDDAVADVVGRLRRLGYPRTVVVPAGFARELAADLDAPELAGTTFHGALIGDSAVARIITERARAALHDLEHGRDGIDDGLAADDGHGYAHDHTGHSHTGAGHDHTGPADDHQTFAPAHQPPEINRQSTRDPWPTGSRTTSTAPTRSRSTPAGRPSP
ncbi:MAG: cobalamin biosynthesis protein CbiX [Ilumatobacteraceae bacterium]